MKHDKRMKFERINQTDTLFHSKMDYLISRTCD